MNLACKLCLLVGLFEAVVWFFDPFQVHKALNDHKTMELPMRLAAAFVNGGVLALTGFASQQKSPLMAAFTTAFAATFTFSQWTFWWWPYMLGEASGTQEMINEHKEQLAHLPRLLPAIGNHLVPDIEHTLLLPISLLMFFVLAVTYVHHASHVEGFFAPRVLGFAAFLLGDVQLAFLFQSEIASKEAGPLLSAFSIWGSMGVVYYFSAQGAKRLEVSLQAKRDKQKKSSNKEDTKKKK